MQKALSYLLDTHTAVHSTSLDFSVKAFRFVQLEISE